MTGEHQKGYQWRDNPRSMEKKRRAKERHFGLDENKAGGSIPVEFWVKKENLNSPFGIVANNTAGKFRVFYQSQELNCLLDPHLPTSLAYQIVVGDRALILTEQDHCYITNLAERKTVLSRIRRDSTRFGSPKPEDEQIIAANIDAAVIVASVRNPPIKPSFIDRYLVLIQRNGIEPIIVFNKSDLGTEGKDLELYYHSLGLRVVRTSTQSGSGINELKNIIKGKTIVFVGQSGVGKSSLVNSVTGESLRKIGQVGDRTGRGHHITTDSELLVWNPHSMIIDTPGIKSLEVLEIPREQLQYYYSDIGKIAEACKYSDCLHLQESEDTCAVKQAVTRGIIPTKRYQSYLRILEELQ